MRGPEYRLKTMRVFWGGVVIAACGALLKDSAIAGVGALIAVAGGMARVY